MIRSIILAALAIFATGAVSQAGYPSRDVQLETLLANRSVLVEAPTVQLHSAAGPFHASLLAVCLASDNQVRLIAGAAKVCLETYTPRRMAPVCRRYGLVEPVSPVVVTETSCAKWTHRWPRDPRPSCERWIETRIDYSLPVELNVRRLLLGRGGIRYPGAVLFTKTYQIPACVQ